jgi:hypothetical protein
VARANQRCCDPHGGHNSWNQRLTLRSHDTGARRRHKAGDPREGSWRVWTRFACGRVCRRGDGRFRYARTAEESARSDWTGAERCRHSLCSWRQGGRCGLGPRRPLRRRRGHLDPSGPGSLVCNKCRRAWRALTAVRRAPYPVAIAPTRPVLFTGPDCRTFTSPLSSHVTV